MILTLLLYNPFWLKMFEHEYIKGRGGMGILHMGSKESYVIIQPKFVGQGRKVVNFRGTLPFTCRTENINSPENQ